MDRTMNGLAVSEWLDRFGFIIGIMSVERSARMNMDIQSLGFGEYAVAPSAPHPIFERMIWYVISIKSEY
jgi:hypothetical protein